MSEKTEAELLADARKGRFPIRLPFAKNRAKAPFMGSVYRQDIEPAGDYMIVVGKALWANLPGHDYGYVIFRRPLVVEHVSTGHDGWKGKLVDRFGAVGKALTRALLKAGYDGVLTYDRDSFSEIVAFTADKTIVRSF